jgi:hypothetical protein
MRAALSAAALWSFLLYRGAAAFVDRYSNELGHIEFHIVAYAISSAGATSAPPTRHSTTRRYTRFRELHAAIQPLLSPMLSAAFPMPKLWLHPPHKLRKRQTMLQTYLHDVLNAGRMLDAVSHFIGIPPPAAPSLADPANPVGMPVGVPVEPVGLPVPLPMGTVPMGTAVKGAETSASSGGDDGMPLS